jgi:hypothetical protein
MTQEKISIPKDEWKLIQEYYKTHEEQLKLQRIRSPTMLLRHWILDKYREIEQNITTHLERINTDSTGIKIFDRQLTGNRLVHVTFTPQGIKCDHCETDNCEHVKYALTQTNVQEILKEKKKEGWNLPDT